MAGSRDRSQVPGPGTWVLGPYHRTMQNPYSDLVGSHGVARLTVTAADLATTLGSGDVEVLGTPRLVALCEEATVAAVVDRVPPGMTTVGTRVELDHLRANRDGDQVKAIANLSEVDGRRLTFTVEATDADGVVGKGTVIRAVVERSRFG